MCLRSASLAPYLSYTALLVMIRLSQRKSSSGAVGFLVVMRTLNLSTTVASLMGRVTAAFCLLCGSVRMRVRECTMSSAVTGLPSLNLYRWSSSKSQLLGSSTVQLLASRGSHLATFQLYLHRGPLISV